MVHSDDKGLVVPPKVLEVQVIVIHVPHNDSDVNKEIMNACSETVQTLCAMGIRTEEDLGDNYTPGWKYSHWEIKGVPLRIEIGAKDLANKQVRTVSRDNGKKIDIPMAGLADTVKVLLDDIQQSMFLVAKDKRDVCVQVIKTWDEFIEALGQKKLILAPWCDEEMLKDAGLGEVTAENRTEQFIEVLQRELARVEKEKEEFIQDFTEGDYNDIVGGWKAKLVRTGSGEQMWGLFIA